MAKYCANCGKELPDEAMYCPDCGKKFIPRYRADDSDSNDEFSGPFGASDKKFEGPFGPHSNRGSNDSSSSERRVENSPTKSIESLSPVKMCLIVFAVLLFASLIVTLATNSHDSNDYDSSVITDTANDLNSSIDKFNNQDIDGKGSVDNNEPYNMSIDKTTYLSGKGEVKLIDFNHSYNIESDNFNITEYETYYVNVDDNDWYVLDIFKCKFDTKSESQVYSTDTSNGDPIIIYGSKGSYDGYGILIPNSSNNSKYKNTEFLESIFHYKLQK
ncbi:zinc ribbon domain-containing protein [uncultured Methanobrevibacter sp.]|uniref:zinc ribbon domain-containing protein n=1 Tax=uncultured Methanobrevibacter sp. TaxID=253161 RepID=UPI0025DD37F1|nr:zinc ribbon domain-containing protein [uncultured Methanobrevibacter sp.]